MPSIMVRPLYFPYSYQVYIINKKLKSCWLCSNIDFLILRGTAGEPPVSPQERLFRAPGREGLQRVLQLYWRRKHRDHLSHEPPLRWVLGHMCMAGFFGESQLRREQHEWVLVLRPLRRWPLCAVSYSFYIEEEIDFRFSRVLHSYFGIHQVKFKMTAIVKVSPVYFLAVFGQRQRHFVDKF